MTIPPIQITRRGFTLLELIIVTAIISLLALLLIAGTQRAIASAQRSKCLSNLRQWGVVMSQFTADNNGAFPRSFPWNDGRAWYNAGYSLVTDYILKGPDDTEGMRRWNRGQNINGCPAHPRLYDSYVYNFHLGNSDPRAIAPSQYIGHRSRIDTPSQILMIADAPATGPAQSGFSRSTPERIGLCHAGTFNGLYVDGHVETHDTVELQSILPQ